MIIGIDASRAVNEQAGIGRATREVTRHLIESSPEDQFRLLVTFVRDSRGDKKRWTDGLMQEFPNVTVKTASWPGRLKQWLYGQRWWSIKSLLPGSEVMLAPSPLEVALGEATPQVVVVHDISHALFPEQRGGSVSRWLSRRDRQVMAKARAIIAISESTKNDLVKTYRVDPDKITVVPLACNDFFKVLPGTAREPFFLFVGTINPRKNLIGLLKAFAQLPDNLRQDYKLKIAGAEGWRTGPIFETLRKLRLAGNVEFLGHLDDEQLRLLYNRAAAFVYPSFYEGFGIPILEAMACGCPVITSRTSSMPEVAGQAALLVDPGKPVEIAQAMIRLTSEPRLWSKLHEDGLKRVKNFSWRKTTESMLGLLHQTGRR